MDTIDLVTALSEIGLLGAVVLGFGGAYWLLRRDKKNGDGQHVVDMFVQNQERIATSLERLSEGMVHVQTGTDKLVELHIKMEARREVLAGHVGGGHD